MDNLLERRWFNYSYLIKKIQKGAYTRIDQISPEAIEVLEGLLEVDPDLRLTAS